MSFRVQTSSQTWGQKSAELETIGLKMKNLLRFFSKVETYARLCSKQAWSLLPTQAIFSSVIPGEYMAGHVGGMIEFPKWLGKYSRQNKFDRILQELQVSKNLNVIGPCLNNDIC